MKIEVDLAPAVLDKIKEIAEQRGVTFDDALNDIVRFGLKAQSADRPRYRLPTRSMGFRPGVDLTKALQLAGELEDEEIMGKMKGDAERYK